MIPLDWLLKHVGNIIRDVLSRCTCSLYLPNQEDIRSSIRSLQCALLNWFWNIIKILVYLSREKTNNHLFPSIFCWSNVSCFLASLRWDVKSHLFARLLGTLKFDEWRFYWCWFLWEKLFYSHWWVMMNNDLLLT